MAIVTVGRLRLLFIDKVLNPMYIQVENQSHWRSFARKYAEGR